MRTRHGLAALGAGLVTALAMVAAPAAAFATGVGTPVTDSGTATITAGALTFTAPTTVGFAATLAGVDQNVTANQVFEVSDATGSAAGWNITATSTQFLVSGHTLSLTGVTEQAAPVAACDAGVACTIATYGAVVTYPYTLPAAAITAPTATKIVSAQATTGMGNQSSTNIMQLAVPASTFSGTYLSTWTYTLATGP